MRCVSRRQRAWLATTLSPALSMLTASDAQVLTMGTLDMADTKLNTPAAPFVFFSLHVLPPSCMPATSSAAWLRSAATATDTSLPASTWLRLPPRDLLLLLPTFSTFLLLLLLPCGSLLAPLCLCAPCALLLLLWERSLLLPLLLLGGAADGLVLRWTLRLLSAACACELSSEPSPVDAVTQGSPLLRESCACLPACEVVPSA